MKLHLTTAFFDFRDAEHVRRLAAVFAAANARRVPIVIHMRTMNPEYGRRDAEIFLSQVMTRAPDVPVQVAHLAGWGGYGAETNGALSVFAEAFASGDRRVTNLYFDLTQVTAVSPSTAERMIQRIRRIGMDRMLFGVDGVGTPGQAWQAWQSLTRLPFTRDEVARIATNLAPWLRP